MISRKAVPETEKRCFKELVCALMRSVPSKVSFLREILKGLQYSGGFWARVLQEIVILSILNLKDDTTIDVSLWGFGENGEKEIFEMICRSVEKCGGLVYGEKI